MGRNMSRNDLVTMVIKEQWSIPAALLWERDVDPKF